MSYRIVLKDASYSWEVRAGRVDALHHISLEFTCGIPYLICGRSGSGKTTLGLLCGGLVKPASGEVYFEGANSDSRRVAVVFQFPETLFFEDSVRKEFQSIHGNQSDTVAAAWLTELGLDYSSLAERLPEKLSSAEGRLTAVALQLSREPNLLILDEPTIGLDAKHRNALLQCIRKWLTPERMLIIVTHDLALMRVFGGETCILNQGKLERRIRTDELMRNNSLLQQYELI